MQVVMSKKKKYIILLLGILVLSAVTAGIYVFVNPRTNDSTSYTVDKYSDVTNWCDTSLKDGKLSVNCKALLINIDVNSCFEVQVITKDKELKELTVCESGDTLTYTNEVLGYKKLMPVDMVFTYSKEGILGEYSFKNVLFDEVDEEYIQGIVNEDIANLVTIDPSTTTIENSVDFCPRPESLPSYVTDENRTTYTGYFNKNILTPQQYNNKELYNLDDSVIRVFWGCASRINLGYSVQCNKLDFVNFKNVYLFNSTPQMPVWASPITEEDTMKLKQISYMYDDTKYLMYSYLPYASPESTNTNSITIQNVFENFMQELNTSGNVNDQVFCSMYSLLGETKDLNNSISTYRSKMKEILNNNISQIHSIDCYSIVEDSDNVSNLGVYLKGFYLSKDSNLSIYNRCSNLQEFIK
ncbi:MAG: hypothetical protein UR14_C0010G0002 [candidate division TM6 bacterium GW2011_GWE2_31_21]|nr:MAG: hypothetical protein UR14_C0010G0002 [candidate division TM6 bacterium GW2011_GWE2_31_21]